MQSDFSKGIESIEFMNLLASAGILYGRCFRHLINNCNSNASNAKERLVRESKSRNCLIIGHYTDILFSIFF
jgi:hypothetical protein